MKRYSSSQHSQRTARTTGRIERDFLLADSPLNWKYVRRIRGVDIYTIQVPRRFVRGRGG